MKHLSAAPVSFVRRAADRFLTMFISIFNINYATSIQSFLLKYFASTNHKVIGLLYLVFGIVSASIGTMLSVFNLLIISMPQLDYSIYLIVLFFTFAYIIKNIAIMSAGNIDSFYRMNLYDSYNFIIAKILAREVFRNFNVRDQEVLFMEEYA